MDRAERLKWARERAGFGSPREAAKHFRWNENTYKSREGGLRDYGVDEAKDYSRAFDVSWIWLVSGEGDPEKQNTVAVVGLVGAGNSIESESEQVYNAEPLFTVETDVPIPADAFALQVRGESMWPRYDDGDVIVCSRHSQNLAGIIGWEAAVGTADGNRYLKRVTTGSRNGLFDLESHNAPTMRDVQVVWASQVLTVVRAAHWRKMDAAAKSRVIRKAIA